MLKTSSALAHLAKRQAQFGTTLVAQQLSASQDSSKKNLFKYQDSLPRLPVPTLEETLPKYLETIKPLLTPEEYVKTEAIVKAFPKKEGPKLQDLLLQRAKAAKHSWLEDWWNNLAYLEYRDPICIWVNYCYVLQDENYLINGQKPANPQTNRAARMVSSALTFKHLVETEELEPDMLKTTPTCSCQYPFLFNACRIPRDVRDEMISHPGSRHITVIRSNRFYSVDVYDNNGHPLSPAAIEDQLQKVIELDNQDKKPSPFVGLFTAEHRDEWAKIYKDLSADPVNKATLHSIQSSVLAVCLDEAAPERLHELSELLLHSDAKNRWFDKQIQIIVFKNGKAGFNYEHARIDGMTTIRLTNYIFEESQKLAMGDKLGSNKQPARLNWSWNSKLQSHLDSASKNVAALIQDNETESIDFRAFGGNGLKKLKLSPDSFVQLAFQLGYFRINAQLCATYESCSTKEFHHGRTEVVRSATSAALDFCRAMERNSNLSLKQRQELMNKALSAHNNYMKHAKAVKGVDRHLFGLRMLASENALPKPEIFQDVAYGRSSHWRLSTSNCGSPHLRLFGFGPVVNDGYGLGYMIHDNDISVNVTAKRHCKETSARLLANSIEQALLEMHTIASGVLSKM